MMSDVSELQEHATRLTRQIGLIRAGCGIDELIKKIEAIEREIGELRHDNNRLTCENDEIMGSLTSLISLVENTRLSEMPDKFKGAGKKLDAILELDRSIDAPAAATTMARSSDSTDKLAVPKVG